MTMSNPNFPIPYPLIKENEQSYFINCIINWLFGTKIKSEDHKNDIVRVFEWHDPDVIPMNNDGMPDILIEEFEFTPVSKIGDYYSIILQIESPDDFDFWGITRHSCILISLHEVIRNNFEELLIAAVNHFQIPKVLNDNEYRGEYKIIALILDALNNIVNDENRQLVSKLYTNLGDVKLFLLNDFIAPVDPNHLYTSFTCEYIFSKTSSDAITKNIINLFHERQIVLSKVISSPSYNKPLKPNKSIAKWEIEDIILPNHLDQFFLFEQGFIDVKAIEKNSDGKLRWVKKRIDLISFIIILFEHGYINKRKFEKHRIRCRMVFEERYNFNLGQSFEPARINKIKIKDQIDSHKKFPVYSSIVE